VRGSSMETRPWHPLPRRQHRRMRRPALLAAACADRVWRRVHGVLSPGGYVHRMETRPQFWAEALTAFPFIRVVTIWCVHPRNLSSFPRFIFLFHYLFVWLQDEASSACLQPVRWNVHEQYATGTPGQVIVWYALGQIISNFSSKLLFHPV